MWPYWRQSQHHILHACLQRLFQLAIHFGASNGIETCLVWLIIMNHKDCHFKCQNWSWDAKIIRGQSEKKRKEKTYLSLSIHIGSHKCLKNKPRIMSLIEHTIQTHGNTCPLVFVRNYKPCHIPLSCRHMISAWSRPAYLTIFVVILDWMAPSG